MKKVIVLLLLIPTLSFNIKPNKVDIVGKWSGKDKNEIGSFIFESDGYAKIELRGQLTGGKNFKMGDKSAKMTYKYYADKKPVEIDIIISELNGKHINTIYLFAEFKDNNTMKVAFLRGGKNRPKIFTDNNSIILTRED
jgi:hypothetical protein